MFSTPIPSLQMRRPEAAARMIQAAREQSGVGWRVAATLSVFLSDRLLLMRVAHFWQSNFV